MTLVGDLDLPELDYFDPDLKGPRFHSVMREIAKLGRMLGEVLGFRQSRSMVCGRAVSPVAQQ